MNNLQVFENQDSKQIIEQIYQKEIFNKNFCIYGSVQEPLFLAIDVANWIEHSSPNKMIQSLDEDEYLHGTIVRSGQKRTVAMISEGGLYEVLFRSRKPIAKKFKKEVN